jgi:DNA modification methylase
MKNHLLIQGDARHIPLKEKSVHMCVTSPPYFNLRDYGTARWEGDDPGCDHVDVATTEAKARTKPAHGRMIVDRIVSETQLAHLAHQVQYRAVCGRCGARRVDRQIGLEQSPGDYITALVDAFREVKRVLRDDGLLWIVIGDSFAGSWGNQGRKEGSGTQRPINGPMIQDLEPYPIKGTNTGKIPAGSGLKPKDCIGIPWMSAFALRADGWWLRDAITWVKAQVDEDDNLEGSAMPGSQQDRCTSAYEMVFMFSKKPKYFYDRLGCLTKSGATLRNVWKVNPEQSPLPHYAMMPCELARRCILLATSAKGVCARCGAPWIRLIEHGNMITSGPNRLAIKPRSKNRGPGSTPIADRPADGYGDLPKREIRMLGWRPSCRCDAGEPVGAVVLDPFAGCGTTVLVAEALGRRGIGVDLSAEYLGHARRRIERPHAPVRRARKAEEAYPLFEGHDHDG